MTTSTGSRFVEPHKNQPARGLIGFCLLVLIAFMGLNLGASSAFGRYWVRGTNLNDQFWPNINEPDKFLLMVDSMADFQREEMADGTRIVFEDYHFQGRFYFGGIKFRAGVFVAHDLNDRAIKDLSLGFGFATQRPIFFDLSVAYLMRNLPSENQDGWTANAQLGYEVRLSYNVKYRIRFRILGNFMYKMIDTDSGIVNSLQFFPMVGLDFET